MDAFVFAAGKVAIEQPDGQYHLVGFADRDLDPGVYLILQRALEFDAQDIASGMDTYHVEWCDQDASGYGGIAQFVLRPDRAEITFAPETAEALEGMTHLAITFELGPCAQAALRQALTHIFAGSGCLVIADAPAWRNDGDE